ncbi:IPKB inhibitor, partial [Amia calva]|nr:IPKB inhibitor [Amia calva]
MTEVEPVLDFASSGRSGRRNALPDILGSPAGVGPSDLPLKLAELSLAGVCCSLTPVLTCIQQHLPSASLNSESHLAHHPPRSQLSCHRCHQSTLSSPPPHCLGFVLWVCLSLSLTVDFPVSLLKVVCLSVCLLTLEGCLSLLCTTELVCCLSPLSLSHTHSVSETGCLYNISWYRHLTETHKTWCSVYSMCCHCCVFLVVFCMSWKLNVGQLGLLPECSS